MRPLTRAEANPGNITNFKTAYETRCEIKKNLFEAAGLAQEIIRINNSVTAEDLPGGFNNRINHLNDQGIEQGIMDQLDNRMALVCEYLRDLETFRRANEGFTIMSEPEKKTICHHCKRELNVPGFYTAYTFMGEIYCDNCIQIFNPESDEPKTNRKNQEFLSENLEDEK